MKIDNLNLLAELERLAAALPWDEVEMQIRRKPEGMLSFCTYAPSNEKFGFDYLFGHGKSPQEAVDNAIEGAKAQRRDPDLARNKKIEQLQEQIAKLQAVIIAMPPYRPNRELTEGSATVQHPVLEV